MMRIIFALAVALLPSLATGGECPMALPPPPKFDHPYSGELLEYSLPMDKIDAACNELKPSAQRTGGCGFEVFEHDPKNLNRIVRRYGIVVYPEGCRAVRRHEIGHVNGWVHPN